MLYKKRNVNQSGILPDLFLKRKLCDKNTNLEKKAKLSESLILLTEAHIATSKQLVFESPVRSGFWPLRPKTGTGTGPTKFECSKRPDRTHVGPDQCKTAVQTGHRTGLNQSWSRPVIHYGNIIYILLNNEYTN